MSSSNNIFKKTSFLAGNNTEFIEKVYSEFLSNPNSISDDWKNFFNGLNDDRNVIDKDLRGPSWTPKKIRRNKVKNKLLLFLIFSQNNYGFFS